MQELFQNALERSKMIIRTHEDQFQGLVDILLKKETLEGSEIEEIKNGNNHKPREKLAYV